MDKDTTLDLALEALEGVVKNCWRDIPSWRLDEIKKHITAIKQARSAPAQEPVATLLLQSKQNFELNFGSNGYADWIYKDIAELLDTTPPAAQRQWVGLTDEERWVIFEKNQTTNSVINAIEAKLKEKNT